MKYIHKISLFALLVIFGVKGNAQAFYDLNVTSHDKKTVVLNSLKAKKIMIIILGDDSTAAPLIRQLIAFEARNKDAINIIGVLSYEDGYQGKDKALFSTEVRKSLSSVIFTKGSFTRKGPNQSALIRWLTNKEENKHFAQEVKGVGQKFFIDESGKLYAVLGPDVALDSKMIERVIQRN